jgi:WXG100 family type VII secretion target
MSKIRVDFGQLSTAANSLRQTAENIDNLVAQLDKQTGNLTGAWEGEDADAYKHQWESSIIKSSLTKAISLKASKTADVLNFANTTYSTLHKNIGTRLLIWNECNFNLSGILTRSSAGFTLNMGLLADYILVCKRKLAGSAGSDEAADTEKEKKGIRFLEQTLQEALAAERDIQARASGSDPTQEEILSHLIDQGIVKDEASAKVAIAALARAGFMPNCAFAGDPINMSTGNFVYSQSDLDIPGAYPLTFKRFYNSIGGSTSVIGKNWTHTYNISLKENVSFDDPSVTIIFDDGHAETYHMRTDGSYQAPVGKFNTLEKAGHQENSRTQNTDAQSQPPSQDGTQSTDNGASRFRLTTPAQTTYIFNRDGRLTEISDPNGDANHHIKTILTYEEDRLSQDNLRLSEVTNPSGSFSFAYTPEGQVSEIQDHTGRTVSYTYTDDNLTAVKRADKTQYEFTYDSSGNLKTIVNPVGNTAISNDYDADNRIIRQHFPDGGIFATEYNDSVTTATERNGSIVKYHRDEKYRTVKVEHADSTELTAYNADDQPVRYQDRNGNIRNYAYDTRGNLTQSTDPLGRTTTITYDGKNNPTAIVCPDSSQLSFDYGPAGNMLRSTDPLQRITDLAYTPEGRPNQITLPDGSQYSLAYDERGNITQVTDPQGHTASYTYDTLNRVVQTQNPEGYTLKYTYNSQNNITQVTNNIGLIQNIEYTPLGTVSKFTDFNGAETHYTYNNLNKVEKITDPLGNTTTLSYDKMFNISRVTDPLGHTTEHIYNSHNRLTKVIDPEGNTTAYEYDPKGNVTTVTTAAGTQTHLTYDALDRVIQVTDPNEAVTQYEYDVSGNLVKITDPLNHITEQHFDPAGQLIQTKDPLGHITQYTYTPLGHLETTTDATGGVTRRAYDQGGRLKSITLPAGESETFAYNKNGYVTKVTNNLDQTTQITYDTLDRIITITNPLGHSKHFTYDAIGNIIEVIDENGSATHYTYSLTRDLIKVTDALGHSISYDYDKARRLSKAEQYRLIDNTLATIKEIQTTTYERDKNGTITAIHAPMGKTTHFRYDSLGNVISKAEGDIETLYEYNVVNNLAKLTYADGKTVELTYNPLRQLTEMKDWLGVTTVTKDPLGRPQEITDFEGNTVSYEWDAMNRKTKISYPDTSIDTDTHPHTHADAIAGIGNIANEANTTNTTNNTKNTNTVHYTYNPSGRLARVKSNLGEAHYQYNAIGWLSRAELPNGVTSTYTYTPLGTLDSLTHQRQPAGYPEGQAGNQDIVRAQDLVLDRYHYAYDPAGNIIQIDKHRSDMPESSLGQPLDNGVFKYTYDPLGHLTAIAKGNKNTQYIYDSLGNRIAELTNDSNSNGPTIDSSQDPSLNPNSNPNPNLNPNPMHATKTSRYHEYNALNQLIRTQDQDTLEEYRYDRRGNLTEVLANGALKARYTFDATNMMTQAMTEKGQAHYTYNGAMGRVRRMENFTHAAPMTGQEYQGADAFREMRYILDMTRTHDNLLQTQVTDPRDKHIQNYIWGAQLLGTQGREDFYYLTDHLYTPIRLMSAGEGSHHLPLAYDEFGASLIETTGNVQGNPFGFIGYQREDISGLYYAQARYYEPYQGRFVSEDWYWNPNNMIYGDESFRVNGYSPLPDMFAIRQNANPYTYCLNNPMIYVDNNGLFIGTIVGTVGGAIIGGVMAASRGENVWAGAGAGALAGGLMGAAMDLTVGTFGIGGVVLAGAAAGFLGGGLGSIINQKANTGSVDWGKVGISAGIGAAFGALGGVIGFGMNAAIPFSSIEGLGAQIGYQFGNWTLDLPGTIIQDLIVGIIDNALDCQ